jgi:L-asparaginase
MAIPSDTSLLIVYTGGTIGMVHHPETGVLHPLDFNEISDQVPELKRFGYRLDALAFEPIIDSSNITPDFWIKLVEIIEENYLHYDGFVILHGTDTMAYSASALSFMLGNLSKPVIFTGSQLPIGMLRTDGKENLITAIEIAAIKEEGRAMVPEVCIYFENRLFRGNRTRKYNAEHFNAFSSDNYPPLAEVGIHIEFYKERISYTEPEAELAVFKEMDPAVGILKLFPGITEGYVDHLLSTPGMKALVIETFGSGNAPSSPWFLEKINDAVSRGLICLNVTQCQAGRVEMGRYETSVGLMTAGVQSGYDSTTEAAITKLMNLLGRGLRGEEVKIYLNSCISGEISI